MVATIVKNCKWPHKDYLQMISVIRFYPSIHYFFRVQCTCCSSFFILGKIKIIWDKKLTTTYSSKEIILDSGIFGDTTNSDNWGDYIMEANESPQSTQLFLQLHCRVFRTITGEPGPHVYFSSFRKQMFFSLKWMNLSWLMCSQVLMKLRRN